MKTPKKVCVIGLDAAAPTRVLKLIEEGSIPNIAKLVRTGVMAQNGLVPYPTITPPNWTTLATGAWPGTHGITDYHVWKPGNGLDMSGTHQGFNRNDCLVENIWEAAEKAGKKSIVLNWPSSWPSRLKQGIIVGGNSNIINDWRTPELPNTEAKFSLCGDQIVSTMQYRRGGVKISFEEASDWDNVSASKNQADLEAEFQMTFPGSTYEFEPVTWYLLVQDSQGKGYDRVTLSPTKNYKDAFFTLRLGEWKQRIPVTAKTTEGEVKQGIFSAKIVELSEDAGMFRVYMTGVAETTGWSMPENIAAELIANTKGDCSLRGGGLRAFRQQWVDLDTYTETQNLQNVFLGESAEYLIKNKEWDLFFMHFHATDWIYHAYISFMDPIHTPDPEINKMAEDAERKIYQSLDEMIGRIVAAAGKETLVMLVSDHGAVASGAPVPLLQSLLAKNLIKPLDSGSDMSQALKGAGGGEGGFEALYKAQVDWTQTKVMPQRTVHIFVNLKGRDPHGIIEPGEEYEQVRQEIIDTLMTYVDPATGKRPFSLALRREDARPFGCYGELVGDVIYAIYPWYGGQHGNILPTADYGIGSLRALLVLNGPGIKKGEMLKRTAWITDVVPTICYLLDLPLPEAAEGAVLYQAFQDANFKMKETKTLREGLARMEKSLAGESGTNWDKHDCA